MSNAARSMFAFGIYLIGLGTILVFLPGLAFVVFGLTDTEGVWIRGFGMLLLFLAFFCIQSARKELTEYMRWTVYTRSSVILFFTVFVVMKLANPVLLLFGLIDLMPATWTALALRSSKQSKPIPASITGA